MKRIFRTMCLIAMVALVATSCKKKDEGASIILNIPQAEGFEMDENDAKAYIDVFHGQVFKWSEGDQLRVYNMDFSDYTNSVTTTFGLVSGAGTQHGHFAGSAVGEKKTAYFYFFPASMASGDLMSGNRETFTVPEVQHYNPETYIDPEALVLATDVEHISAENYNMHHIFGFLNVKLVGNTAGKYVKNIVVTDESINLAGTVSLLIPNVNSGVLDGMINQLYGYTDGVTDAAWQQALADEIAHLGYESNPTSRSITLECNNTPASNKYFFFGLRPGCLYGGGEGIITFSDNSTKSFTIPAGNTSLIRPGRFVNVTVSL